MKKGLLILIGIFALIFSLNSFVSANYCLGTIDCSVFGQTNCQDMEELGCYWDGEFCYGSISCSAFDRTSLSICQSYTDCTWQPGCLVDTDCGYGYYCDGEGGYCSGSYITNLLSWGGGVWGLADPWVAGLTYFDDCQPEGFTCTYQGCNKCSDEGNIGHRVHSDNIWYSHECTHTAICTDWWPYLGSAFWSSIATPESPAYSSSSCSGFSQSDCTPSGCSWNKIYGTCKNTPIYDLTPRIAFWSGKVNQHTNASGIWTSDPDCSSGTEFNTAGGRLTYCEKWYLNTKCVKEYLMETITTWRTGITTGCNGPFTSTQQSYKCVQSSSECPNCYNKICGDDGIGGSCGDCAVLFGENYICNEFFQCVAPCTDTCLSKGYECGTHTICGIPTDCGVCPNVFWSLDGTNKITTTEQNSLSISIPYTIKMIVENSGLAQGSTAIFEVFEYDAVFDDNIRTGTSGAITGSVDANGKAVATWTITQADIEKAYGILDEETNAEAIFEFYFKVNNNNNLKSGNFYVQISIGFCEGKISCSNYITSTDCNADSCGVANIDGAGRGVSCVVVGECDTCYCSWNTGSSKCEFASDACGPTCGDGKISAGEECDGIEWGTITECGNFDDFTGGTLSCYPQGNTNECYFDTSKCTGGPGPGPCGNNIVNTGETCDGTDWGPITGCSGLDDFTGGTLSCYPQGNTNECHFDTTQCTKYTLLHTKCNDNMCVTVPGEGVSECAPIGASCTLPPISHADCVDETCVLKSGEGTNTCSKNSDCTLPPAHTECKNNMCVEVAGEGVLGCLPLEASCIPCVGVACHADCVNKMCMLFGSPGLNKCSGNSYCKGVIPTAGTCVYHDTSTDNCDDGYLSQSWTTEWVWDSSCDPACKTANQFQVSECQAKAGSSTTECPAQIQLPFFGVHSLIAAIAIIILIYLILNLKKKHKKK